MQQRKLMTLGLAVLMTFGLLSLDGFHQLRAEADSNVQIQQGAPINLNDATAEQLQTLRGIGPSMADRILKYREEHGRFEKIEDLDNVRGIGPSTLEKIKAQITV